MKKRYLILIPLIFIFAITSSIRLLYLNTYKKNHYHELLIKKTIKIIGGNSAPRGRILDRNGNILVDNIGTKVIAYTKLNNTTKDEIEIATKLAGIIELDIKATKTELKTYWMILNEEKTTNLITEEEYQLLKMRKLTKEEIENLKYERVTEEFLSELNDLDESIAKIYALMNKDFEYSEKIIKNNNVTEAEYAKIIESKIPGIMGKISWDRTYPYGDTLRPIFGSISTSNTGIPKELIEEYQNKGYSLNDRVGISYLEREYEEYLRGEKDQYLVNPDNTLTIYKEGKRGNDLVLSIDINLQLKVESILKAELTNAKEKPNTEYFNHSYTIISDPNTGAILAASGIKISKDINNYYYQDITTNIISSSYTMGSVIKGASSTVGYQNNLITPNKNITDSCIKLYNIPEKCSWKKLGTINDVSALKMSSNYYQFLIAIGLTGTKYTPGMKLEVSKSHFDIYRNTFASFGLGVKTEIDLPNEKIGAIGRTIAPDLLLNYAIGQYDTYTPIQLVQYINTIANGGNRIAPSLMLRIIDNEGNIIKSSEPKILNQVDIEENHLNRIKEGFKEVVYNGTAKGFTSTIYKPAGKTGTSESFYNIDNKNIATISANYVMFAPYDNPKYSMIVISPNISHKDGRSEYLSWAHKYISKQTSDFLFENYK